MLLFILLFFASVTGTFGAQNETNTRRLTEETLDSTTPEGAVADALKSLTDAGSINPRVFMIYNGDNKTVKFYCYNAGSYFAGHSFLNIFAQTTSQVRIAPGGTGLAWCTKSTCKCYADKRGPPLNVAPGQVVGYKYKTPSPSFTHLRDMTSSGKLKKLFDQVGSAAGNIFKGAPKKLLKLVTSFG